MNEIVNKFLLAGDKLMPEMILRQPELTYSACFQHDTVYGDFKDLKRIYLQIKYYMIKHLILLKIQNMMDVNVDLLQ